MKTKALSLLVSLGFIWGSGYSIARFAMTNGITPLGYAFWQAFGPAILLLMIIIIKKIKFPFDWPHIRYYFMTGLLGIAIPNTNMYIAAPHLPAGVLAVVVNTVPIIAYPLALLAKLERFAWLRIIGVLLGICGILCIILPKASLPDNHMIAWVLVALISPLCFASCAILSSRMQGIHTNSLALSAGMLLFAGAMLTPLVFGLHQFVMLAPPFSLAKWVIVLEIILSSIGYILFFELLKNAGPVYYTLVGGLVGLTGVFWGWLIFHETLNIWLILAISFILLAIACVTFKLNAYMKKTNNAS